MHQFETREKPRRSADDKVGGARNWIRGEKKSY